MTIIDINNIIKRIKATEYAKLTGLHFLPGGYKDEATGRYYVFNDEIIENNTPGFGFNYFKLLEKTHQRVEVINDYATEDEDIIQDFISIITSFCGRIYGAHHKNKTQNSLMS